MGDVVLKCPLCCQKTFATKSELIDHIAVILDNIACPICELSLPSLANLVDHLTLDKCHLNITPQTLIFDIDAETSNNDINITCSGLESIPNSKITHTSEPELELTEKPNEIINSFSIDGSSEAIEDNSELGKMYVELLSKQLTKPCLQTQELKLVKDNGEQRYVILANEGPNMTFGSTVVTKQNNDGTISMTTVKDMKVESDTLITPENTMEDSQEEVYSCNTCGVSFTSVIEHIQNYHNDQDVVVEEPMQDSNGESNTIDLNDLADEIAGDKQTSRRMITKTGDIIETPIMINTESPIGTEQQSILRPVKSELKDLKVGEEVTDKDGRVFTRRYVQIECDSIVKQINEPDAKDGPFHRVVLKELRTQSGELIDVYNCMSCHIYVTSLEDFKVHPCKMMKYSCPHCPVSYDNSKSLCAHMKVHKPKQEDTLAPLMFECEICNTIFPTNKSLKLHKRMHDPIKTRPIEPPIHISEGKEVSQEKYQCSICHKIIPVDYKTIHSNSHRDKDMFNCDICNKKFTSNEYLEMHMNVHNVDKVTVTKPDKSLPYSCLYCDRRFARPHEKVKHERIHTGEKPHSCEICGKSFRVSYCLTLHMRTHTGARPYQCPHCDKRFKAHSVYNHHLLTHSDVRAYKCPYCPKAFKTSVQLAGHKNSHTKPFSCQHCNRPFASLYAVRVHTETHSRQNNLKFSCTECGASYARAFALKDHMKQVHKQQYDKEDGLSPVPEAIKSNEWTMSTEGIDSEENQITKDMRQDIPIL